MVTAPRNEGPEETRQTRLLKRLRRLIGEGPAQFLKDAGDLLSDNARLQTSSHLIAHALREVESAIRQILEPFDDGQQPAKCGEGHARSIKKVCRGLELPDDDPLAGAWLELSGKSNPRGLAKFAHRDDLARPRPVDAAFTRWVDRVLAIFDGVLNKAESKYSIVFRTLNDLLGKPAPATNDIEHLKHRVPDTPLTRGYFFERLEHSGWLAPLAESGLLSQVGPLERNEEEGTIGFPPWPARPYLLRMAQTGDPEVQARVLRVLTSLADTDNTRVHTDVADIAAALPPEMAKEVVPFIQRGLRERHHLLLPHRAGELIVYLAGARLVPEAAALARTLLDLQPDRIRSAFYKQELTKVVSALLAADPWASVHLFADLLESAVRRSQGEGNDGRHAHSHTWHPSLTGRGALEEPRDLLLEALLDAVMLVLEQTPDRLRELIAWLEERRWLVFERISLHLLAVIPDAAADLADARAAAVSTYDEPELRTEYVELLQERFPLLGIEEQEAILRHLTAEPDRQEEREHLANWLGRAVTDEEVARDIRRRKYRRLEPLCEHLPSPLKEEFAALAAEFALGEASTVLPAGWGNHSPKSTEELLALSDENLIAYLQGAKFGHERFGPSMEGLGDALSGAAAEAPERTSRLAPGLEGLDPALISALLRGLEMPAKAHKILAWAEVLRLAQWVVDQPREIPGRHARYSDLDPGWVWTRREIASLLQYAFEEGPGALDPGLGGNAWRIIESLLSDPDPASDSDEDPVNAALQSVRGEAIRAAMLYGLWLRRMRPEERTFDSMPEVRSALERHLDPAVDSAPPIRAVYGHLLPLLFKLDPAWVRANLPKLFPGAAGQESLRHAAWEGYVRYQQPLAPLLKELEPEYRHAVVRERARARQETFGPAAQHTAEHIMIFGWQGLINADDPENLLRWFFDQAPLSLRAHAITFVGHALMDTKGDVPTAILERLQRLWEWRSSQFATLPVESISQECVAFGWWFASRKFPPQWALANLRAVLAQGCGVEWEHQVIETLGELSEEYPAPAVQCLDLLLQHQAERWGLELSFEAIKKIIVAAWQSGEAHARELARDVTNRLESMGHHRFGDVLP